MVIFGFIVEGATEKIILESSNFFKHLERLSIQYIPDIIDAGGSGNLLPHNIMNYSKILENKGANKIIILTDLDKDQCITKTRTRISPLPNHILTISIKEIEAWFLSDTTTMRKFLNDSSYYFDNPEVINNPFEEIKSIRILKTGRGIGDKKILAKAMVKNGFSINNAALHPNCNSAKYFLNHISEKDTKN